MFKNMRVNILLSCKNNLHLGGPNPLVFGRTPPCREGTTSVTPHALSSFTYLRFGQLWNPVLCLWMDGGMAVGLLVGG